MTTERSITKTIINNLNCYRPYALFWIKLPGSPMLRRGMPDLLVIRKGKAYFLEIKQPRVKPTKLQQHRIEQIRLSGAVAEVVHSWDDVKRFLGL